MPPSSQEYPHRYGTRDVYRKGSFIVVSSNAPNSRSLRIVAIALAVWITLATLPLTASAQPTGAGPAMDLAALVLMPSDLGAEGMPGYGTEYGLTTATVEEMTHPDLQLESRMWMEPSAIPDSSAVLTDSGWVRYHELLLATPVDPDEPDWFHSGATSSIEEYASPEGASMAFATFSSEPALRSGHLGMVEFLPTTTPLGDERVLARHTFIDEGDTIHGLTQMVRIDNLILSVTLADYDNGIEPDPAAAERLTSKLVSRVQAARDAGASSGPCLLAGTAGLDPLPVSLNDPFATSAGMHMPGLDRCVQRLIGSEAIMAQARYVALDGQAIRMFVETDADLATAQAEVTANGVHDSYRIQFEIDGPGGYTFYYVQISVYTSEQAAMTRFVGAEQEFRDEPGYTQHVFTRNSLDLGDETYSLSRLGDTSGTYATATYARFDNIVVSVRVSGTTAPVPDSVNALLVSQVACMQANDCSTPIPLPPELIRSA
jgi:hypothetical protein